MRRALCTELRRKTFSTSLFEQHRFSSRTMHLSTFFLSVFAVINCIVASSVEPNFRRHVISRALSKPPTPSVSDLKSHLIVPAQDACIFYIGGTHVDNLMRFNLTVLISKKKGAKLRPTRKQTANPLRRSRQRPLNKIKGR